MIPSTLRLRSGQAFFAQDRNGRAKRPLRFRVRSCSFVAIIFRGIREICGLQIVLFNLSVECSFADAEEFRAK